MTYALIARSVPWIWSVMAPIITAQSAFQNLWLTDKRRMALVLGIKEITLTWEKTWVIIKQTAERSPKCLIVELFLLSGFFMLSYWGHYQESFSGLYSLYSSSMSKVHFHSSVHLVCLLGFYLLGDKVVRDKFTSKVLEVIKQHKKHRSLFRSLSGPL